MGQSCLPCLGCLNIPPVNAHCFFLLYFQQMWPLSLLQKARRMLTPCIRILVRDSSLLASQVSQSHEALLLRSEDPKNHAALSSFLPQDSVKTSSSGYFFPPLLGSFQNRTSMVFGGGGRMGQVALVILA